MSTYSRCLRLLDEFMKEHFLHRVSVSIYGLKCFLVCQSKEKKLHQYSCIENCTLKGLFSRKLLEIASTVYGASSLKLNCSKKTPNYFLASLECHSWQEKKKKTYQITKNHSLRERSSKRNNLRWLKPGVDFNGQDHYNLSIYCLMPKSWYPKYVQA